ncbi:MAG TPA: hypothetical protein VN457_07015, partial [Chlamydiales bacterium]|nr:hypothetical protein [Chlamydiales bacterium]
VRKVFFRCGYLFSMILVFLTVSAVVPCLLVLLEVLPSIDSEGLNPAVFALLMILVGVVMAVYTNITRKVLAQYRYFSPIRILGEKLEELGNSSAPPSWSCGLWVIIAIYWSVAFQFFALISPLLVIDMLFAIILACSTTRRIAAMLAAMIGGTTAAICQALEVPYSEVILFVGLVVAFPAGLWLPRLREAILAKALVKSPVSSQR